MLSVIPEDRSKDAWIAATWKQEWEASGPTRVYRHVSDPGEGVKGEDLSRKHWTTLNRLRTGVGRYKASMKKWGLADSAACECGELEQTADHIINSCSLHRPPSEAGLFEVGPLTRAWLQQTDTLKKKIRTRPGCVHAVSAPIERHTAIGVLLPQRPASSEFSSL